MGVRLCPPAVASQHSTGHRTTLLPVTTFHSARSGLCAPWPRWRVCRKGLVCSHLVAVFTQHHYSSPMCVSGMAGMPPL